MRLYFTESLTTTTQTKTTTTREVELRAQLELVNKRIVTQKALYDQKLRAIEREPNERLVMQVQLEQVCTSQKSQLEQAMLQVEHWKYKCERIEYTLSHPNHNNNNDDDDDDDD